jgi:hypothetical protein
MSHIVLAIILTTAALVSGQYQYEPRAALHEDTGGFGSFVSLTSDGFYNNLATVGYSNRAYSTCLLGAWIFYDDLNFNNYGGADMEYIFRPLSAPQCVDFDNLGGRATSARFVGNPINYRDETITFYQHDFFQGPQKYVFMDYPSLNFYASSLIITGQTSWTVYDQPNYEGQGICITPNESPTYEPALVTDTLDMSPEFPHGAIASVRKGCFATKVISIPAGLNNKRVNHNK